MGWTVPNFVAFAVTLLVLAVISAVLRFWARRVSQLKIGLDDVLILPAVVSIPSNTPGQLINYS
jgi:hypothetical protein